MQNRKISKIISLLLQFIHIKIHLLTKMLVYYYEYFKKIKLNSLQTKQHTLHKRAERKKGNGKNIYMMVMINKNKGISFMKQTKIAQKHLISELTIFHLQSFTPLTPLLSI